MNTTSSNTTFFTINENRVKPVDPKTASVTISLEEFEDLMSYCQDDYFKKTYRGNNDEK